MDEEAFRLQVIGATAGAPSQSRILVLRHYCEHIGHFTLESVQHCAQLVRLLAKAGVATASAADTADRATCDELPQTPTAIALSEHLREKIQSWVKRLRKKLTGSTAPPCSSLEEAVEWCQRVEPAWLPTERQSETEQMSWVQHAQQSVLARLERARQSKTEQMPQDTAPQDTEEVPPDFLKPAPQFLGPLTPRHILADMLECVRTHTACAAGQTALSKYIQDHPGYQPILPMLERETRATERMTGFVQVDLAVHVLANTPLRLPAGRIYAHRIFQPGAPCGVDSRKYVVMELYAPDVDFDQLRALYKQARQALDIEKTKAFKAEAQDFLTLVDTAIQANDGKLPRDRGSGAKAFWEQVRQQWNVKMGRQALKTWNGAKQRYYDIQKRVKHLLD